MGYVTEGSGKFLSDFLLLLHAWLDLSAIVSGWTQKAAGRQGHRKDRKQEKASVLWMVETFIGMRMRLITGNKQLKINMKCLKANYFLL